ncbi:MAG: hypothetical protein IKP88_16070 [Lachnospiraceae bacterium]|nr:hypothetical protein [Lachnospiraceae bacterium]
MEIIKLPSEKTKEIKKLRSKNLKKNKNAYNELKKLLVPKEMKLCEFRKYYHPVLSSKEKEMLIGLGMDPWSKEGLKYIGDCKRSKK